MAVQPRRPENDLETGPRTPPRKQPGGISPAAWVLLAGLPAVILVVAVLFWGGYLGWDGGDVDEPVLTDPIRD
jgi:hypothetical protein